MSWSSRSRVAWTSALRLVPVLACTLALGVPAPARALDAEQAAALADRHFRQLFGFDALEAFEVVKGDTSSRFVTARRWRDGRAEIVVDVIRPRELAKLAMLMLHHTDRSPDLFVYFPDDPDVPRAWHRRIRRFYGTAFGVQGPFDLFPLGELRPTAPGELRYRATGEVEIEGERCVLVEGRPAHRGLPFDRLELALSAKSGFALRTRVFAAGREMRRVLISPADLRDYHGRLLPARRRVVVLPRGQVTEIRLHNFLEAPELPDRLFRRQALHAQRFPHF